MHIYFIEIVQSYKSRKAYSFPNWIWHKHINEYFSRDLNRNSQWRVNSITPQLHIINRLSLESDFHTNKIAWKIKMNIVKYTFNLVWCFISTILHCICYLTALLLFKVDLNHDYTLKIFISTEKSTTYVEILNKSGRHRTYFYTYIAF